MRTRRLPGVLGLALAAGHSSRPRARPPGPRRPRPPQRFGVRLFDVPVAEEHDPRAYRYIIDYLPATAVIHRRIMILNEESRPEHFTCTRTRRRSVTARSWATTGPPAAS